MPKGLRAVERLRGGRRLEAKKVVQGGCCSGGGRERDQVKVGVKGVKV